jgi:hypothetical protein
MEKQVRVDLGAVAGMMTTQQTVWCGNCHTWDSVSGNRKSATEEFRRIGWRDSSRQWLCPNCVRSGVKL